MTNNFNNNPNVCILLTMCVNNDKNRLNIYTDRIEKYLKNTTLNFYIVESSNYTFPEYKNNDRIKVYSFKGEKVGTLSTMELDSITRIIDVYNLQTFDVILKITGKYYIPNIEFLVNKVMDKKYSFFIQNTLYNCEIFGAKPEYYKEIQELTKTNDFEDIIPIIIKNKPTFILPIIKLNEFTTRSDGNSLKFL